MPNISTSCTGHRAPFTQVASDGKALIYLVGWTPDNQVDAFDTSTKKWVDVPDMPDSCYSQGVAGLGGKIYIVGGYPCYSSNVYDPQTSKWSGIASSDHESLVDFGMAALGQKIYAVGGQFDEHQEPVPSAEVYDPSTNKWSSLAPMPTARSHLRLAAFNGKLWAVGGFSGSSDDGFIPLTTVEVYGPASNKWTAASPLITARGEFSLAATGSRQHALVFAVSPSAMHRSLLNVPQSAASPIL
jgi:N-acetylneuraminic acid mutarotase